VATLGRPLGPEIGSSQTGGLAKEFDREMRSVIHERLEPSDVAVEGNRCAVVCQCGAVCVYSRDHPGTHGCTECGKQILTDMRRLAEIFIDMLLSLPADERDAWRQRKG
jgi:hypothetical protein